MADASQCRARLLLLESDPIAQESLAALLAGEGFAVTPAATLADAVSHLQAIPHELALVDISQGGDDGLQLLRHIRGAGGSTAVIVLTAYGTLESAVEAMKEGASEYITKPIIEDALRLAVERVLERRQLVEENRRLREALGPGRLSMNWMPRMSQGETGNAQTLESALAGMEKQMIATALDRCGGSRQSAARQLGINRITLYKKMKRHGMME